MLDLNLGILSLFQTGKVISREEFDKNLLVELGKMFFFKREDEKLIQFYKKVLSFLILDQMNFLSIIRRSNLLKWLTRSMRK